MKHIISVLALFSTVYIAVPVSAQTADAVRQEALKIPQDHQAIHEDTSQPPKAPKVIRKTRTEIRESKKGLHVEQVETRKDIKTSDSAIQRELDQDKRELRQEMQELHRDIHGGQ